jgi:hypothetical protein
MNPRSSLATVWRTAALLVLICSVGQLGCDDTTEPQNQVPGRPEITPIDFTILPGDSVLMMVEAQDPDGDILEYDWTFSGGQPTTATGTSLVWYAPGTESEVTVSVRARDGRGGERTVEHIDAITVHQNAAYPYDTPFEGTLEPDLDALQMEKSSLTAPAGTCHFWASVAVTWTNAAVIVFTGIPTLAFLNALTRAPVWLPPDTWRWAYTVPWGSGLATVELYATLDGATEIDWRMLISGTMQSYDRFEWVAGSCLTNATAGYWTLYDHRSSGSQIEALRIDWEREAQTERDIVYQNILVGSETYGDSLYYSIHGDDVAVRLNDVSEETFARIFWNVEDGAGRFIGASGDSCCWGPAPLYDDIDCE